MKIPQSSSQMKNSTVTLQSEEVHCPRLVSKSKNDKIMGRGEPRLRIEGVSEGYMYSNESQHL